MIIRNLSFKFDVKNEDYFFKNLSFACEPHSVHFLQGENGVGKSTLFTIIQGSVEPDALVTGSITIAGVTYDLSNAASRIVLANQIHTVEQRYDHMIAPQCTVRENLQLANLPRYPMVHGLPDVRIACMDFITFDMDKPAYLLSGGQRQLLAIFMALQKPTKVLLLDEPTATLDKKNAQMVMQTLQNLAATLKVTMLVICHDNELVSQYARGNTVHMQQLENGNRVIQVVT